MTKQPEWEVINGRGLCGDTCRLQVPGGWLYRERECAQRDSITTALALTFVPRKEPQQ
jgi:hypothetical protein